MFHAASVREPDRLAIHGNEIRKTGNHLSMFLRGCGRLAGAGGKQEWKSSGQGY
ncbi:hypothetical protein GKA01_04180 [Gluconobacter kanchanaburiensis NBRC 103587]|uniref:Uncharacterized protein n=1 Tax=Gluconobacter kanchanaburiensis NBRC 103587 TaxID=1307948 RepID=A0A511B6F3_9PROT|nr:hypothetical protein AA103587_0071 [Gluconobacter kanchanaburiensis NBRC 103587]GEK95221.1 hypothetical protein GKA01_04180 [Gluconobacter kanchanaburiensis NBRC 103587]